MPTNRRFARGFSNLHRLMPLSLGLSLGLVTSSAAADPAVKSARATLAFDSLDFSGQPTGSVCTTGPIRCHAHAKVTLEGHVQSAAAPQGFGPADLQQAYNIPTSVSGTPTVAIVDAYGYTNLESDLATYRSTYGLPPCTQANGCLKIVNQNGQTTPLPPNPPAKYKDEATKAAMTIRTHIGGCGAPLQALVKQIRGAVYMNLGAMRLTDLAADIQDALAKTGPGETTLPFISAAGVELIVRCDQPPPKVQVYTPPTREQVEAQLVDEQLSIMARRYLRDLRRSADVETR